VPWKHNERSAELFARAALQEARPDGIIVCDGTAYYPLVLMQRQMEDVSGVVIERHGAMARRYAHDPAALARAVQAGRIYIISPALNFVATEYRQDFVLRQQPGGILYRLATHGQG
jgi:hypothetical protein